MGIAKAIAVEGADAFSEGGDGEIPAGEAIEPEKM